MFKKGDKVVQLLNGGGTTTASIQTVCKVNKKKSLAYLDPEHIEDDGVSTFNLDTGYAVCDYISGFTKRIVILEQGGVEE